MRFIITCWFIISSVAIHAADDTNSGTDNTSTSTNTANTAAAQKKISLGISIDKEETPFAGAQGVGIYSVHLNSNAARLGLKKNDRIIKVNESEITNFNTLAACLAPLTDGSKVTINFIRDDKEQSCTGILRAQVTARDVKKREASLQERLDAIDAQTIGKERYDLKDLLIILRQIEHDLPAAAKEFKKTYPNGRFRISMNIDIDSDTTLSDADTDAQAKDSDADTPTKTDE